MKPNNLSSARASGHIDSIEEEQRVLYAALTRPHDELIITRKLEANSFRSTSPQAQQSSATEAYI